MLNPMMSSLSRWRRLPDCKVIRSALCSLPLNGDGRRLRLTKITITVTFCSLSFLVSGIFTWEQARLTNRKLLQLPIILGTKIQRTVLTEHNPVRRSLLCCSEKDGQWKAGLQWDSIWLIYDETSQIPNANWGRSALSIEGRTVKCLVIT